MAEEEFFEVDDDDTGDDIDDYDDDYDMDDEDDYDESTDSMDAKELIDKAKVHLEDHGLSVPHETDDPMEFLAHLCTAAETSSRTKEMMEMENPGGDEYSMEDFSEEAAPLMMSKWTDKRRQLSSHQKNNPDSSQANKKLTEHSQKGLEQHKKNQRWRLSVIEKASDKQIAKPVELKKLEKAVRSFKLNLVGTKSHKRLDHRILTLNAMLKEGATHRNLDRMNLSEHGTASNALDQDKEAMDAENRVVAFFSGESHTING